MSITKGEFFKYIGEKDSLSGYTRSYKLVLYRILIDDVIHNRVSYVIEVAKKFKDFYLARKETGKIADKDVDMVIANIENSSIEQVINIIMINPYKHIHSRGFLNVLQDANQNKYFAFDYLLRKSITAFEWCVLSARIDNKIELYFSQIDNDNKTELSDEIPVKSNDNVEIKSSNDGASVIDSGVATAQVGAKKYCGDQILINAVENNATTANVKNSVPDENEASVIEYNKPLEQVKFSGSFSGITKNYSPAVFCIDDSIFRLNSWEELFKVFFYVVGRTQKGDEFFESICDCFIEGIGKRISKNDINLNNPCKFSKNMYVDCKKAIAIKNFNDANKHVIANLEFINYVRESLDVKFDLWICKVESENEIDADCEKIIKKLSSKKKKNKFKVVKTKNVIARINEEILSDAEKFYVRIEKEYDKKVLLGDITINADEEEMLKEYMKRDLLRLNHTGTSFKPFREKIFAFGLVRFAMKYYSDGTFWPFFKQEYGIDVKTNNQREINNWFRMIMKHSGKTYDDTLPQKIDNISLHSFVTDNCAEQFFDYLFDFWRKELKRNIENMYGDGNEIFKALIDEIKLNNSVGINNVMKHTSMALELNEKSCRLRIRRFLKLMDECFWRGDVIPETGNRFNELLRKWMAIPNGKFRSEFRVKAKGKGVMGQKFLSKPQLQVRFDNNEFSLRLPREILPHCSKEEHPYWEIASEGHEPIIICPVLMQGAVFLYTEEIEATIPQELLFERISMTLYSEKRKFVTFSIKADEIRLFNDEGKYIDYSNSLPAGNLYCYSAVEEIPQILYKEAQVAQSIGNMYLGVYQVENGDIVIMRNKHATQVGGKIYEGINGLHEQDGVIAVRYNKEYRIYSELPKILFKAPKESVGGVAIIIPEAEKTVYRLTDYAYQEFKIDDNLDEVYAYLIDLNELDLNEGCYQVSINVPYSQKQYNYSFCYIKDFGFRFDDAPYIFKDTGSVCFNKSLHIEIDGDKWEETESVNRLNLNFDPESAEFSDEYIHKWKLELNYVLPNEVVALKFDIPIFLWRYSIGDDWSIGKPADIFLKNLPNKLYVSGPFSFVDKSKNKLFIDLKNIANEDTDMFAEHVKGEDCFAFLLANFKSWLNHDIEKQCINIKLDGKEYQFLNVFCKSIVLSHSLIGDFESNKLYGAFDVFGDSEYTVSIKRDNEIIAEDVPLVDGKFTLETEKIFGVYAVKVYELFDDDSGFDSYNIEIGSYNIRIKDLKNLNQKVLQIKEIKDIRGKYAPIRLADRYSLVRLQKTEFSKLQENDIELLGLWREDKSDDELAELPMYECDIIDGYGDRIKGLLIFYSRVDIKSAVILELTQDGAVSLCYDSYRGRLIAESQADKFKKYEKFKRTTILQDDLYTFVVE